MSGFSRSYRGLAAFALMAQVAGAFIVGFVSPGRWGDAAIAETTPPSSALGAGVNAILVVLSTVIIGFLLRYVAYGFLDSTKATSRIIWVAIVAFEVVYAAINLYILWVASGPEVDAGLAWILAVGLAVPVTIASLVILIVGIVFRARARRRETAALLKQA